MGKRYTTTKPVLTGALQTKPKNAKLPWWGWLFLGLMFSTLVYMALDKMGG